MSLILYNVYINMLNTYQVSVELGALLCVNFIQALIRASQKIPATTQGKITKTNPETNGKEVHQNANSPNE
jgi:hypothetical protein